MTGSIANRRTIGIWAATIGQVCYRARGGLRFFVPYLEPGANPPAGDVAHARPPPAMNEVDAADALPNRVDIVTFEFDNNPDRMRWRRD